MKHPGLKYGLLGGLAVVLYFLLFYFARKELFLDPYIQWFSMVIYLACMIQATREDVAKHGTQRDFREMSRVPFVVFLLVNLAYWLFYYSLHLADPSLLAMENQAQLDMLQQQLQSGTGDPEQMNRIREQVQYLQKDDMMMALGPVLMRMCIGALGGFGLAAAITAYFRFRENLD
jgi:hypothetical protein